MKYFTEIEEGQAVIFANGVYRQVKLAERGGKVYAKYGAGYVRLHRGGGSSHPKVRWHEIDAGETGYHESGMHVLVGAAVRAVA